MSCFKYLIPVILFLLLPIQQEFVGFRKQESSIEITDKKLKAQLVFQVLPGYHIQAESEVPDNIIPTSVRFEANKFYKISDHSFKIPTYDTVVLGETIHKVISDKFRLEVEIVPQKKFNTQTLKGVLSYQACDDRQCFFPRNLPFEIRL